MRTAALEMRDISIHAPHEGERPVWVMALRLPERISIHAPHEGERPTHMAKWI